MPDHPGFRSASAKTLSEFVHIVSDCPLDWEVDDDEWSQPWFRGHSDARFSLTPRLYRAGYRELADEGRLDEEEARDDFRLRALPFNAKVASESEWDRYCLMQHYGFPTRLLDWSSSAMIALYFAVGMEARPQVHQSKSCDAAVWMLDAWWLNKTLGHNGQLFETSERKARSYLPRTNRKGTKLPLRPMAILAPYNSPRITAQRGLFTIHGKRHDALEAYCLDRPSKNRLLRIVIPGSVCGKMLYELRAAGTTATSVFPDLDGLCRELFQEATNLPDD